MKNPFSDIIAPALDKLSQVPTEHPIGEALIKRLAQQHQLVTREEFDAQARLLASYEEKIIELETELSRLEQALSTRAETADPANATEPDAQ